MNTLAPTPSPTHTHFETSSVGGTTIHEHSSFRSPSHKKKLDGEGEDHDDSEERTERPELDLSQDESIDAGPFSFKPVQLASLVDPKNLPALTQMGGVTGLLRGLGTHRKHGLQNLGPGSSGQHSRHSVKGKDADRSGDGRPDAGTSGAGDGASQRHDRPDTEMEAVPGIMVTGEDGEAEEAKIEELAAASRDEIAGGNAYNATLEDRHHVFGENVLPSRKTKSLLQLMWLALKDKVLVSTAFVSSMP
jgi:P-type Ca2+ transporter type 2C